jgi:hypothetical protein
LGKFQKTGVRLFSRPVIWVKPFADFKHDAWQKHIAKKSR